MNRTDWDAYFASLIGRVDGERSWPMTMDSRFRMASVSKMFTVFTLMELAEAGKLSLDDDVSEYLGFRLRHPSYPDVPITLRMLASHTSGLRDGRVYSIPPSVRVQAFFTPLKIYHRKIYK